MIMGPFLLLVPMSERRHRISDLELPEVVEGLRLRLLELTKRRNEPEKAEIAYRCLLRLINDSPGRPKYPEFNWDHVLYFVEDGEDHIKECVYKITHSQRT